VRNSVRFLLLGIGAGVVTPLALVLYALAVDGPVDPIRLGVGLVIGGALALGAAGFLLGRKEDQLAAQNRALRDLSDRLQALSTTDALTGVPNRRALDERLEGELGRSQRYGTPLAAVMIDLDHFKRLNDHHGHAAGDAVLRHVARVLDSEKRRGDIIARYGGEEFVALLYGANGEESRTFAETVRRAVEEHRFASGPGGAPRQVTISGGCATFPRPAGTEEDLIKTADEKLYQAKAQGRNRVVA